MTTLTYGEIRKDVEIKLNRRFMNATQEQVKKIRELAPVVANGEMSMADAVLEVDSL